MFYASLFWEYLKNFMKTRMTYRSNFWIEILTDLMFNGLNLVIILIMFQHTPLLAGWTQEQVLFIYGYFMIPYGIFITFFNLWNFGDRYIVKGEMDRILTRPAYNLSQLVLENLDPASLFSALAGAVVMVYASMKIGIDWSWYDPFVFLVLVIGSVLIYGGVYITLTALSFFSDSPTGILPLVYNIQNYGRYPVTIYNKLMKALLTWILPFAFVGFYPSTYFLDRANWGVYIVLTPVVGIICFGIALTVWNIGVRKYRGAGS